MEDFLSDLIQERSAANEHFADLVEAAFQRRELIRRLAEIRAERSISQTQLAARMGTSQSAIARLESGDSDARPRHWDGTPRQSGIASSSRLLMARRRGLA